MRTDLSQTLGVNGSFVQGHFSTSARVRLARANRDHPTNQVDLVPSKQAGLRIAHARIQGEHDERIQHAAATSHARFAQRVFLGSERMISDIRSEPRCTAAPMIRSWSNS